jgi:DNA-binding MarR family transcriptional regulator
MLRPDGFQNSNAVREEPPRREFHQRVVALVTYVRKSRALRRRFLNADLFGEPAWDILLDLYAAHLKQTRLALGSICAASGIPHTTAVRWQKALEVNGLIERRPDPLDQRRLFVSLTSAGAAAMDDLFAAIETAMPKDQEAR